jgi:hypothetical protein
MQQRTPSGSFAGLSGTAEGIPLTIRLAVEGVANDCSGRWPHESDDVFGDDGGVHELGKVSGSVDEGYTAELTAAVTAG